MIPQSLRSSFLLVGFVLGCSIVGLLWFRIFCCLVLCLLRCLLLFFSHLSILCLPHFLPHIIDNSRKGVVFLRIPQLHKWLQHLHSLDRLDNFSLPFLPPNLRLLHVPQQLQMVANDKSQLLVLRPSGFVGPPKDDLRLFDLLDHCIEDLE